MMSKSADFLVLDSPFLREVFSREEISENFNIVFASPENFKSELKSAEESLENSDDGQIFLVLDESFADRGKIASVQPLGIPVIIVSEKLTEEQSIILYESGADDIIKNVSNTRLLVCKFKSIINKFRTMSRKITEIEEDVEKKARKISEIDSKTGVYTSDAFARKAAELVRSNPDKDYLILRLDIDRFKVFNEIYGFENGDKILSQLGSDLKKLHGKANGEVCGRVRADHFVMCIRKQGFNPAEYQEYVTNFLADISPGFYFNVRFGICEVPKDFDDINICIGHSLSALLSIKGEFNLKFAYYSSEMSKMLRDEEELISDMIYALENNEFEVWLQPQFDYASDTLSGAEALVRWKHPKKGLISPGLFVPVFERNGFITRLDEYVWDKAFALVRKWIDKELNPVPVSVNISRRDIYNTDVTGRFKSLLEKYSLSPENIRLEITESAYMENPQQLISVVKELQEVGFCVEMDDFGSGYSSLNTLKEVPVDVLKLDMKFISDYASGSSLTVNSNSKAGSILSSVVRMANWLNLPVIAEGIETKEQADYLKSIGCFNMQGYYFAKPMPADEYEKLLETIPTVEELPEAEPTGIENAVNFLDASTQSTLLFNSYVGGAAIIEWTGETVEALRINDQFLEELGTTRLDYEKLHRNMLEHFEPESQSVFISNLLESEKTGKPSFCEVLCKPIYKNQRPFWIRIRVRHLSKTVTSNIFYLTLDNIDFRMHLLEANTTLSEQLSGIMESVDCGIESSVYDDETDTISVSYLNESFARIFGYGQSEFRVKISENPFFFFKPEDQETKRNLFHSFVKNGRPEFSLRTSGLAKDGTEKHLYIHGKSSERNDGLRNLTIMVIDLDKSYEPENILR